MKKIILFSFVLFLINSIDVYSQRWNGYFPDENDSLYVKAIEEYIAKQELHPNRYIKPNKSEKILYITAEQHLLDIPKQIKGYEIILLWPNNRWQYYKQNNKTLVVLEFIPLTFENGKFYIDIKQMVTTMKNSNKIDWIRMGMEVTTYFKFENGKMVYESTEIGGIY